MYGPIRQCIKIQLKIRAFRRPLLGRPMVLHAHFLNVFTCENVSPSHDLGKHVARLAGRANEDLAGLAAQHGGLGGDTGWQAAEGKFKGVLQPLPGVVFPELAQLRAGVLTLMPVTIWRHPGQQGDQDRGVLVGEIGRVTQRVHAAR
jgi:hypothetical protein